MERWIQGLKDMLDTVLKHPETPAERWVLLIVACLACVIVLRITSAAFGMGSSSGFRSLIVSLVGLALILLGMTAVTLAFVTAGVWIRAAAVVAVSLILVIPMICFLLRGNYIVAFFAWLISLGAVVGVIMMLSAGFDAVAAGTKEAGKAKSHKQDLEQILGDAKESPAPARPAR